MQFTVPAVLDAVAATIGDRVLLTQGDRRYTYAAGRRAVQPSRLVPACARAWLPHRARHPGRSRGRTGLGGHLRLQRQRVRRVAARRVPRTGRAVQRQLPLRQERIALSAGRFRCDRADLSRHLRAAGRRRPAESATPAGAHPDRRRLGQRPGARCGRLRGRPGRRRAGAAAGRAVARRPVRALHRRHHGHAQGRAVAPARHLHDVLRRTRPLQRQGRRVVRRDRRAGGGRHGNQAHGASAAHSRRRTVGRHDGTHHGPVGGIRLGGGSPGRRRSGRHDRTRAGDGRDGGRRRNGADRSRPPSNAGRPTCHRWPWWPTAVPCSPRPPSNG